MDLAVLNRSRSISTAASPSGVLPALQVPSLPTLSLPRPPASWYSLLRASTFILLHVAAVDRGGDKGMDRVEGTVLQLRVSSPMPDVIRVETRHHHPAERGHTAFDLDS